MGMSSGPSPASKDRSKHLPWLRKDNTEQFWVLGVTVRENSRDHDPWVGCPGSQQVPSIRKCLIPLGLEAGKPGCSRNGISWELWGGNSWECSGASPGPSQFSSGPAAPCVPSQELFLAWDHPREVSGKSAAAPWLEVSIPRVWSSFSGIWDPSQGSGVHSWGLGPILWIWSSSLRSGVCSQALEFVSRLWSPFQGSGIFFPGSGIHPWDPESIPGIWGPSPGSGVHPWDPDSIPRIWSPFP